MTYERIGRRAAVGVLGAALLGAASMGGCSQHAPEAIGDLPDGYVRLARGAISPARAQGDRGLLDPTKRIANLSMAFKLSPEQRADREALKAALVDPGSPSFRKFLTVPEYAARFGAPRATVERAKAWLSAQGLEVHEDSPLGARVTFSGTVERLQEAFRTEMHRYEVEGELHYAMARAPALPAELAAVVTEITNTHDFHPKPMLRMPKQPDYSSGTKKGFAPPDWANVYDAAKLYTTGVGGKQIDGTGVTIAIVGVAEIAKSDVDAWRTTFNLGPTQLTMTLVPNTGVATAGSQGTGFEAVLDVEWSGGIAPGAHVNYVYTGGSDYNVDDATFYAIENNLAPVLSESWGGCEGDYYTAGLTAADQNVIDTYGSAANVLGITYVAASGDAGATTCLAGQGGSGGLYVSVPAAYPGVTSVGGTQFPGASLSGNPYFTAWSNAETTWNEAHHPPNIAAGGGGVSVLFDRPSYQSGLPACAMVGSLPVAGIVAANQRVVPDVSFTSAEGIGTVPLFIECTITAAQDCGSGGGNPKLTTGGGTSFATPAFAGVVALMNQAAGGRLGNINPVLYNLGTTTPTAFHDITTGNNQVNCTPGTDPGCDPSGTYGFPATAGFDCATGLGSMDVYDAVAAVAARAPTTTALGVMPTTTTEGMPVQLTATVDVPQPNASNLSGVVTFAFESYDMDGGTDLSWTLGTAPITGGTTAQGTATFMGAVPPGLVKPGMQSADLVAMYGGDATHLPSTSAKVPLGFGPVSFSIQPAMPMVGLGGKINFTSMGGVGAVKWYTGVDTTCDMANPPNCSKIVETTGVFTAGPNKGTTQVFALDADSAEAMVTVQVVCMPATACNAGSDCGTAPDGCGGTIMCGGGCTAPEVCGGGGTPNKCGCTPATSCPTGDNCGTAPDGCGGMVMCGTCPAGQTCSGNQCVSSTTSSTSSSSSSGSGTGGAPLAGSSASSSGTGGSTPVHKGGCGCRTAGDPQGPRASLSALGVLALAGAMRFRKRRSVPARRARASRGGGATAWSRSGRWCWWGW
jgi:MYXO-CTERM domain-containing protein